MRSELYASLRDATRGEFELVGELDCDAGWIAYLATGCADGAPAILLLHRAAEDGQFDLQVARALDGSLAVGKTTCPACGAAWDGWPRFCGACRHDLSGVAPDAAVPGSSPAELLDEVRRAAEGVYEVLGIVPHAEGGGATYFAREEGGRIVGLVLEREADGVLSLVRSWACDHEALAGEGPAVWTSPAGTPEPDAEAVAAAVPADLPPAQDAVPWPAEVFPAHPDPVRPERRAGARRPSRKVLYAAAGALLVLAGVVLGVAAVRQKPAPTIAAAPPVVQTPVPLPVPVQPVQAFVDSTTLPAPSPAPSAAAPRPARRTRPAPRPVDTPAAAVEPARPDVPAAPTAEEDRQAVLGAVERYAAAVQSRQLARVRAAYPGMSAEEEARWRAWFAHFDGGVGLVVSHSVSQGPHVEGDVARVVFTLTMRYQGQRHQVASRATLHREGGGWALHEVRTPQ